MISVHSPSAVPVLTFPGCSSPLLDGQSSYRSPLLCMSMSVSAAGNLITALMHQREEEGEVVRRRNAALQFLFSPVMGRGLPGFFKCLM